MLPILSGCFVGTEKPDLALDIPENYRETHGSADAHLPALDWWRGFRSGELTALMEAAQADNLDIAQAVARIVQADAQVRIAGAPLLPSADYNFNMQRTRSAGTAAVPGRESGLYSSSFSASYVLDFWGKNRAALLATQETALASRFDKEVVALSTLTTVANTYFTMLEAQDRIRIAHDNITAAERVLRIIRDRYLVGTASQLDIAQQDSVVATQRASIPPLEITLRQAQVALAVLVGRTPEKFAPRGGTMLSIRVPPVTPGLPSDVLNQRPDLREAEAKLASANYSVESARASFFPNIALTAQYGHQSSALQSLFMPNAWFYSMAASLAQPIFDGGLLIGELEQAKGKQQELVQAYRKAVLSSFSDVEQALISIDQQATRERLQQQVVRAASEAFRLSEERLKAGTVDLTTVLAAEQTLFQGQDTLAQVRFARLQAVIALYQALGGGWPPLEQQKTATQ